MSNSSHILTINSGSSSIKFSFYMLGEAERLVLEGELGRVGLSQGFMEVKDQKGKALIAQEQNLPDHEAALKTLFAWLQSHEIGKNLDAVGHRLVHGGPAYVKPQPVSAALIADLKRLIPLAPDHLPDEIQALEAVHRQFPKLPQVACFDTAFHRHMPEVAQDMPCPGLSSTRVCGAMAFTGFPTNIS